MKIENVDQLIPTLVKLQEKYVEDLKATEQHFEIGDTAYVMDSNYSHYEPKKVIITELSDFRQKYGDGGYVYYWYKDADISKSQDIFRVVLWRIWYYSPTFIRKLWYKVFKYDGISDKHGPGHSVGAGRNDFLFKDKKQCLIDWYVTSAIHSIDELHYLIDEDMKDI